MLFNIYMCKLPSPPKDINITSYADDITLSTSHTQVEKLRDMTTLYLNILHDSLESRKLKLSAEKSSATVFTTRRPSLTHTSISTIHQYQLSPKSMYWVLPLIGCFFGANVKSSKENLKRKKYWKRLLLATGTAQKRYSQWLTKLSVKASWTTLLPFRLPPSATQTGTTCKRNKTLLFAQLPAV